ncbi:MAG: hypothetical protein IKG77_09650 [Prevotella sp.]|nr:hypothetical protein [Prevotella sp.]
MKRKARFSFHFQAKSNMDGAKLQKRVTGGLVAFSGEVAKKRWKKD